MKQKGNFKADSTVLLFSIENIKMCVVIQSLMFVISGAESPEAVRKLMSLSDKVRPHNSKTNPLPTRNALMLAKSPRIGVRHPSSPKQVKPAAPVAVALSAEDSSVASFANMAIGNRKSNAVKLCKCNLYRILSSVPPRSVCTL